METPENIELVLVYKIDPDETEFRQEKIIAKKMDPFYVISSIPQFAKNIAYGDKIKVVWEKGAFHFDKMIEESGHSVLHIVIIDLEEKQKILNKLSNFGCTVNTTIADNYLAVDIPPAIPYHLIKDFLDRMTVNEVINYTESCLSAIHRDTQDL